MILRGVWWWRVLRVCVGNARREVEKSLVRVGGEVKESRKKRVSRRVEK